ncbi:MAG TPA: SUMF1/EgtB/PvdO family nonheme iron enzyme [Polyangiaceae bacterium]|nr:SUMF1/EgtB/PvdO family nonheme iron enzyme [Polyangiaceae bacterium]
MALCACLFGCGQAPQLASFLGSETATDDASAASKLGAGSASHGLGDIHADTGSLGSAGGACPAGMAHIKDYCIDRYEAFVVELDAAGRETPHSPYTPVDGLTVRAKVAEGVVPQGYISQVQAQSACRNAGKRLCTAPEFSLACRGPNRDASYPYGGTRRQRGKCNEGKGSAVNAVFGQGAPFDNQLMNDERLNRWAGGLAKTGAYAASVSPFGVFDLVGNLHEWGAEVAPNGHGAFRGGFYGDAEINGPGCNYVTTAHAAVYHDYSTGFRCCRDAE